MGSATDREFLVLDGITTAWSRAFQNCKLLCFQIPSIFLLSFFFFACVAFVKAWVPELA